MMASRVLRTLADRGLIERHADAGNGRIVLVEFTTAGHDLVLAAVKAAAETDGGFFPEAGTRARLRTELRALVEDRSSD